MRIPNVDRAIVPEAKVTRYLLDRSHAAGGSKAAFFLRFGFSLAEWPLLAEALRKQARENDVVEEEVTSHGTRYVVDGPLDSPDGVVLNVRSAWYIDQIGGIPRFVTAHPLPRS